MLLALLTVAAATTDPGYSQFWDASLLAGLAGSVNYNTFYSAQAPEEKRADRNEMLLIMDDPGSRGRAARDVSREVPPDLAEQQAYQRYASSGHWPPRPSHPPFSHLSLQASVAVSFTAFLVGALVAVSRNRVLLTPTNHRAARQPPTVLV
jgi:hypothetical protein